MLKLLSKLKVNLAASSKICRLNSSTSPFNVFDRELKKRQRNQTAFDPNHSDYEYIKEEVGYRVADRIFDIKRTFNTILDLGCQRGHVSKHLTKDMVNKIYMFDSADKVLEQAEAPKDGVIVEKRVFDEEDNLPFDDNSLDLITSSLSLHWVNNLPKLFKESMRCLKKDCAFTGALFAGETLFELRVSMQLAELERKGGITSRISPFTSPQDIGGLLSANGFRLLTLDYDEIRIAYPSIFELMYDIKGMGEGNCTWQRKLNLNKDLLMATQAIYKEMYGNEDGTIPATYQILYFIGWKPDESQPKPAKRGSAQVSLKDLDKVFDGKKK